LSNRSSFYRFVSCILKILFLRLNLTKPLNKWQPWTYFWTYFLQSYMFICIIWISLSTWPLTVFGIAYATGIKVIELCKYSHYILNIAILFCRWKGERGDLLTAIQERQKRMGEYVYNQVHSSNIPGMMCVC